MIDWHTHVLPGVDDGSQSVAESLDLLKALRLQNVDTVIATPHYNANHESLDRFLQRRNESMKRLSEEHQGNCPKVLLGAEVRYYPGISRLEGIEHLKIDGSRLLLLEMPQSKWTEYTLRELIELSGRSDIVPMLAHIERSLSFQSDDVLFRLCESGVFMQVNATFFTNLFTKRKALHMLENGRIHFIGSDCHNLTNRPPKLGQAFECISKKFGTDFICQLNEFGASMLV